MSGRVPLEVGTRGTIGSLLKKEIDFFRKADFERAETTTSQETAAVRRSSWPSFRFSMSNWRRKKRRSSGICSVVEVADSDRLNEIPGFGYLNLRAHSQRYDV